MASRLHAEETVRSTRGAGYNLDPILIEYKSVGSFVLAAGLPVISVLLFHGRIRLE